MKKKILITLASIGASVIIASVAFLIKTLNDGDLEALKVDMIDEF